MKWRNIRFAPTMTATAQTKAGRLRQLIAGSDRTSLHTTASGFSKHGGWDMRTLINVLIACGALALVVLASRQAHAADLQAVNRQVNASIQPMSDMDQYGLAERWVIDPPSGKGDCEDYALTKMQRLIEQGVPLESMSILRVMGGREMHAVLAVGEVVLDNRYPKLLRRKDFTVLHETTGKSAMFRARLSLRGPQ